MRRYRSVALSLAVALIEEGRGDEARRVLERARPFVGAPARAAMTVLAVLPSRVQRWLVGSAMRIRAALSR